MATSEMPSISTVGNLSTVDPAEEFHCSLFDGDQHLCVCKEKHSLLMVHFKDKNNILNFSFGDFILFVCAQKWVDPRLSSNILFGTNRGICEFNRLYSI